MMLKVDRERSSRLKEDFMQCSVRRMILGYTLKFAASLLFSSPPLLKPPSLVMVDVLVVLQFRLVLTISTVIVNVFLEPRVHMVGMSQTACP